MKVLFNGLGPRDTATYNGKLYNNGSVVEMEDDVAAAYINVKLAVELKTAEDEKEAAALQRLEEKNAERRKVIKEKAAARKESE